MKSICQKIYRKEFADNMKRIVKTQISHKLYDGVSYKILNSIMDSNYDEWVFIFREIGERVNS